MNEKYVHVTYPTGWALVFDKKTGFRVLRSGDPDWAAYSRGYAEHLALSLVESMRRATSGGGHG